MANSSLPMILQKVELHNYIVPQVSTKPLAPSFPRLPVCFIASSSSSCTKTPDVTASAQFNPLPKYTITATTLNKYLTMKNNPIILSLILISYNARVVELVNHALEMYTLEHGVN